MRNAELFNMLPDNDAQVLVEFIDVGGPYHGSGLVTDVVTEGKPNDTAIYAIYPRGERVSSKQLRDQLYDRDPQGGAQLFHPAACNCGISGLPGDSWFDLARVRTYASGNRVVLIAGALRSTT